MDLTVEDIDSLVTSSNRCKELLDELKSRYRGVNNTGIFNDTIRYQIADHGVEFQVLRSIFEWMSRELRNCKTDELTHLIKNFEGALLKSKNKDAANRLQVLGSRKFVDGQAQADESTIVKHMDTLSNAVKTGDLDTFEKSAKVIVGKDEAIQHVMEELYDVDKSILEFILEKDSKSYTQQYRKLIKPLLFLASQASNGRDLKVKLFSGSENKKVRKPVLLQALESKAFPVAKILIDAGANIFEMHDRKNALDIIHESSPEMFQYLLHKSITVDNIEDKDFKIRLDVTSLHYEKKRIVQSNRNDSEFQLRHFNMDRIANLAIGFGVYDWILKSTNKRQSRVKKTAFGHPTVKVLLQAMYSQMKIAFWGTLILQLVIHILVGMGCYFTYFTPSAHSYILKVNQINNDTRSSTSGSSVSNLVDGQLWHEILIPIATLLRVTFTVWRMPIPWSMYFKSAEDCFQRFFDVLLILNLLPQYCQFAQHPAFFYIALLTLFVNGVLVLMIFGNSNINCSIFKSHYVHIYEQILKRFLSVGLTFSPLVIMFAMLFSLIFKDSEHFGNLGLTLLRMPIMLVGEIGYDKVQEYDKIGVLPLIIGQIVIALFACIGATVLFNIFLGFTVNDIKELERKAEVIQQKRFAMQLSLLQTQMTYFRDQITEIRRCFRKRSDSSESIPLTCVETEGHADPINRKQLKSIEVDTKTLPASLREKLRNWIIDERNAGHDEECKCKCNRHRS